MLELASCLKLGGWSAARYKLTWFGLSSIRSKPAGGEGIVELVYAGGGETRPCVREVCAMVPTHGRVIFFCERSPGAASPRHPKLHSGKAWSFGYSQDAVGGMPRKNGGTSLSSPSAGSG